jgi:hypothetical protein
MNVLVITMMIPFVRTIEDALHEHLVEQLHLQGISAETIRIPVTADSAERLIDEMVVCRSLQVINVDRIIALNFPAYLVPHADKVCWLTDYWKHVDDSMECGGFRIPKTPRGKEIARLIQSSDNECLGQARRLFAASSSIRDRLKACSGLESDILMLPSKGANPSLTWGATIKRLLS